MLYTIFNKKTGAELYFFETEDKKIVATAIRDMDIYMAFPMPIPVPSLSLNIIRLFNLDVFMKNNIIVISFLNEYYRFNLTLVLNRFIYKPNNIISCALHVRKLVEIQKKETELRLKYCLQNNLEIVDQTLYFQACKNKGIIVLGEPSILRKFNIIMNNPEYTKIWQTEPKQYDLLKEIKNSKKHFFISNNRIVYYNILSGIYSCINLHPKTLGKYFCVIQETSNVWTNSLLSPEETYLGGRQSMEIMRIFIHCFPRNI